MNPKTILCPVDFSPYNNAANELASALARQWDAKIIYLTVPDQTNSSDYEIAMERIATEQMGKLKQFQPTLDGIPFEHAVRISSNTARTIVEFADASNVDLIVMANHGKTGLLSMLMGSVTEAVVRSANCEVLTVRAAEVKPA